MRAGAWWFGSRRRPEQFVLPEAVEHALLFVTAGSGVTPIMGMLRALAQRSGGLPDIAHVHIAPSADDGLRR